MFSPDQARAVMFGGVLPWLPYELIRSTRHFQYLYCYYVIVIKNDEEKYY